MLTHSKELKDRVEARRKELESRLAKLRAEGRAEAREEVSRLEKRLGELQERVKSGWEDLTEESAKRLNELLKN